MKFDSNLAWKQASSAIAANREVLLALSGVFFLLPSLALSLFFPQPEPAAGQTQEQVLALMGDYYTSILPVVIPMTLVQAAGTLAMLTLFTDRSRPTVGTAIRQGFAGILTYFLAQLMLGIAIGVAGGILLAIGAASGAPAAIGFAIAAVVAAAIYVAIKTSLVAPIVAVEHQRNPVAAIKRSWSLTKGNSARIGLFYALVIVAFFVVMAISMGLVGIALAVVAGDETARFAAAVVSSALGAVMTLYLVAVVAAIHRQLAGPSPDVVSAPFE